LYVSVEPVANHNRAFWIKVVPTINQPHDAKEKMKSVSILPAKHAYSCVKR
jgi:hypothetical protein